eukprot:TRINITY_DN43884_c0_g1_i1.p1 TRINITY_DN43884_c0_g1~~TRINITY_DN43884_c0_g1_i1.p1  ORF type:complete len:374 (+),score=68.31 TRINITY_DN43884_c0_g1_i1:74-1123(+)
MDAALEAHLEAHHLQQFRGGLLKLGVGCATDITLLHDADLASLGMTVVQIRKLQSVSKSQERGEANGGAKPRGSKRPSKEAVFPMMQGTQGVESRFWKMQGGGRPLRLIFIRHGESEANVHREITASVPDHMLHLTAKGREQALDAGLRLKSLVGSGAVKFVVSPYVRTQETLAGIRHAWGDQPPPYRTDVRIREQEYGNFDSPEIKSFHKEKKMFGAFYYRFPNGESPADCYDRASSFVESLYRSWEDNTIENHVIVGHGLMILVMLMRLMRMRVDEYSLLEPLNNCEFVVLERAIDVAKFSISYTWSKGEEKFFGGLRRKEPSAQDREPVWDGDPEAELLVSDPAKK